MPTLSEKERQQITDRFQGVKNPVKLIHFTQELDCKPCAITRLQPEIVAPLQQLTVPVHLEVLVTPTCPYCPGIVHLAHRLAIESDLVTADMVEGTEYPDLVRRYSVEGVPKTVVNQSVWIDGAVPKVGFVARVVEGAAMGKELPRVVR